MKIGIRGRIILMVVSALILSILIAAWMFRNLIHNNVISQKMLTADILTASFVNDIKYDIDRRSLESIADVIISKYMTYYRVIEGIHIFNSEGKLIASSSEKKKDFISNDALVKKTISFAVPTITWNQTHDFLGILSVYPILQGSKVIGAVELDISITDLQAILFEVNMDIAVILFITVSIAVLLLFILLRGAVLKRLTNLMNVTQEISSGNYGIKVYDEGKDEIGALAQSFNRMTVELKLAKIKIEDYNKHLEAKVRESTSKLHKAYDDLKNAQGQIVLHEKMASIGVLISGIAHEINTPVGTINNVSRELKSKVKNLPHAIQQFSHIPSISPEDMLSCLEEILDTAKEIDFLPSYEKIRNIETLLQEHDVKEWRKVSLVLSKLNFLDEKKIIKYLHIFAEPAALDLIETIGNIANAVTISETSTYKIQNIIKALKYYAYTDHDKVEKIQINKSVRTALVLLENAFKHEVEIVTNIDEDLPLVYCTSEIHQVWTNLLSNAFRAIKGNNNNEKGKIIITTRQVDSDNILVSITDNGMGIPKENLDNIFDPFFTTSDIGEGTGLGLTIVAGIVKKHNGHISVDSKPGKTVFTIILPIQGFNENSKSDDANE